MAIATLALSLAVSKYSQTDTDNPEKQPLLTRLIHRYDSIQEGFRTQDALNTEFIEAAGRDRHLFETEPPTGHMNLKFPEYVLMLNKIHEKQAIN